MKNHFTPPLKKFNFCLILSVFTLFVFIHSCKKDRNKDVPLTKTELITEAKSFFEDEIINLPQLSDNNPRHSLNKIPQWDKASIKKISIGDAVIVPIKYEKETLIKPEGEQLPISLEKTSYLLVYKNKQQKLQAEWVTVIADKTISNGNKFVGTIAIEDWNGKFKRGFAFGAEGDILPVYLNSAITYKKIAYGKWRNCFTILHYGYVMGYPQIVGTETFCFNEGGGGSGNNDQEQDEDDDDGTSGGGGDTGPDDYTPDCDGVVGSGAYTNTDCNTCMGGTTGVTECPPKAILDSVKNPCLKAQTSVALTAKTTIRQMLNNTFGGTTKFEDFDLIIKDTTNLANDIDAEMQPLSGIEYEIRLNRNKL